MSEANIFVIPDIHGRYDLLTEILRILGEEGCLHLSRGDKLIFLGDMIDRGPQSRDVLELIMCLEKVHENVIVLKGNHEEIALTCMRDPSAENMSWWAGNGGLATLDSYPDREIPVQTLGWLTGLKLSHEEPGFFFSHAPVPRESHRSILRKGQPFNEYELTWTFSADEPGVARDFKNGIVGVCGHVHALRKGIMEPRFYDHYIYADAGCGCHPKAPLVAIEVKSRKVYYAFLKEEI